MSEKFSTMTDEELEAIARLQENSTVPGSRFQRAMTELDLRHSKIGFQNKSFKEKVWYERPFGIVFLAVVSGTILFFLPKIFADHSALPPSQLVSNSPDSVITQNQTGGTN